MTFQMKLHAKSVFFLEGGSYFKRTYVIANNHESGPLLRAPSKLSSAVLAVETLFQLRS